jgi:hypothetical protein
VAEAAQYDGEALAKLIREVPRLSFNAERGSVQVVNCSSTATVANIPVSAELLSVAATAAAHAVSE